MSIKAAARITIFLLLLGTSSKAQMASFEQSTLVIDTGAGARSFTIELAVNERQKEQGLMFRRTMAADAGMLFDLGETQQAAFWMKNTLIPLDMLFITEAGCIADIHERAVPLSEASIFSKVPVRAVLELNGGTVARLGIKSGDRVRHPWFDRGSASVCAPG